ncbi:SPFH domain-containing protein [Archangium lansingense]|uniref:SPFH domain-containing protein n=1 Tax=Archangium lansingense TaxID=2995310 RepID=A0ABT4A8K3_9BACT|nr:SPFH domain-containing protein [Archangium lansinium]MCY1077985.1 SPFH domain-containing protein [Archangium lansinium]
MSKAGDQILSALKQPRMRLLWPIGVLLFGGLFAYNACTVYIRPYESGVKQVILGGEKGIRDTVYGPGLHWVTPGAERMHRFPMDLQLLEMADNPSEVGEGADHRVVRAIKIQTSEGYTVSADVTVLYRIENPYKVMTQIGPGRLYEDSAVIPRAEQVLRRTLGEMDADDFYKGDRRDKAVAQAQKLLVAELEPKGIKVTHVLLRQYRYDSRYQQAIEQRKIQDQSVFKNMAEAAAAQAEAEKNKIIAQGQATVQVELSRGDAEVAKLRSEADLYRRTKAAEGDLVVKLARAKGIELENAALRGAGSENMVGLKMADVLGGTQVIVVPTDGEGGVNPLDLNAALRRFDVKGM